MDRSVAGRLVASAEAAIGNLHDLLTEAQSVLTSEEFEAVRLAIAKILVSIEMDVLRPVYLQHRDLDKHGYFRRESTAGPDTADPRGPKGK
jgi:hypothetical protein